MSINLAALIVEPASTTKVGKTVSRPGLVINNNNNNNKAKQKKKQQQTNKQTNKKTKQKTHTHKQTKAKAKENKNTPPFLTLSNTETPRAWQNMMRMSCLHCITVPEDYPHSK